MSQESLPISPAAFAAAIADLPVGNLYAKASELQNSISHLHNSNAQLEEFPEDPDCKDAIKENVEVIKRMEGRIDMLKNEVAGRGLRWPDEEGLKEGVIEPGEMPATATVNGTTGATAGLNGTNDTQATTSATRSNAPSGALTDEQLRRLLAERLGEPDDAHDEDEGMHL